VEEFQSLQSERAENGQRNFKSVEASLWLRSFVAKGASQDDQPSLTVRSYFAKIAAFAGLAADWAATTLIVASTSLVTGGRQISVLQA
jgi:hypothetical protein